MKSNPNPLQSSLSRTISCRNLLPVLPFTQEGQAALEGSAVVQLLRTLQLLLDCALSAAHEVPPATVHSAPPDSAPSTTRMTLRVLLLFKV